MSCISVFRVRFTRRKQYLSTVIPANTRFIPTHADKFIAGAGAGLTAVALTYPLDTIRARLAFQVSGEHRYRGIAHAATSIYRNEGGWRALYRGFVPTLFGMVPYAGFSFFCFENVKSLCMQYSPTYTCRKCDKNTGKL